MNGYADDDVGVGMIMVIVVCRPVCWYWLLNV